MKQRQSKLPNRTKPGKSRINIKWSGLCPRRNWNELFWL